MNFWFSKFKNPSNKKNAIRHNKVFPLNFLQPHGPSQKKLYKNLIDPPTEFLTPFAFAFFGKNCLSYFLN
jgi:hypothetical protein